MTPSSEVTMNVLIVIDSDVRCQGQIFHIFSNRVLQLSPVSHTSLQKIQQFYVFNNFQDSIELRDRGRCEYPFYCVRNFNGHSSCFHCISSFFLKKKLCSRLHKKMKSRKLGKKSQMFLLVNCMYDHLYLSVISAT